MLVPNSSVPVTVLAVVLVVVFEAVIAVVPVAAIVAVLAAAIVEVLAAAIVAVIAAKIVWLGLWRSCEGRKWHWQRRKVKKWRGGGRQ